MLLDGNASWYVNLSDHPVIEIGGPEHREWFERISSQASVNSKEGESIGSAFLSANGGCHAFFEVYFHSDKIWLLANPWNRSIIMDYLEESHFGEDLYFKVVEKSKRYFLFQAKNIKTSQPQTFIISHSIWPGQEVIDLEGDTEPSFEKKDFPFFRHQLFMNHIPISALDLRSEHMILEAPLKNYVTDEKGCYPGQETIAKVFTYGRVAKSFFRAIVEGDKSTWLGEKVFSEDDKKIGEVASLFTYSGKTYLWLRLTQTLAKKAEEKNLSLKINGETVSILK